MTIADNIVLYMPSHSKVLDESPKRGIMRQDRIQDSEIAFADDLFVLFFAGCLECLDIKLYN